MSEVSGNATWACDPRLSGVASCPSEAQWKEAAHITWSVFLIATLSALFAVGAKIIKR